MELFYDFRIDGEARGFSYLRLDQWALLSLTRFLLENASVFENRFELGLAGGRALRCRHGDGRWIDMSTAPPNAWPGCAYPLILGRVHEEAPYRYVGLSEDDGRELATLELTRRGDVITEREGARRVREFVMEGDTPRHIDWGAPHPVASIPDRLPSPGQASSFIRAGDDERRALRDSRPSLSGRPRLHLVPVHDARGDAPLSRALPQGNRSVVTLAADGGSVVKRYNSNGDPRGKCAREVAFYRQYAGMGLLPPLLDAGDDWIRLGVVRADRLADRPVQDVSALTRSYAKALIGLFADAPAPNAGTLDACGARSARVTRDSTFEALVGYAAAGPPSPIIDAIRFSLARIVLTRDLLTKLDWNSTNIFVEGERVVRFIDFEQACLGTGEMLAGAVLLNPAFEARQLFDALCAAGICAVGAADIVHYMNLAFAQVLLDSVARSGRRWPDDRLEEAYRKHVFARHLALMEASSPDYS